MRGVLIAVLLLLAAPVQAQKMYKWVDEQGRTHYTQTPPTEGKLLSKSESPVQEPGDPKYCMAVHKLALAIADAMRRGARLEDIVGRMRSIEEGNNPGGERLEEPVLRQVTYYVYGFKAASTSSGQIAELVHNQCLNGGYNPGKSAKKKTANDAQKQEGEGYTSGGTGWAVAGGYVVTNYHVVRNRTDIVVVRNNGEKLTASVLAQDEANDLVLLRVFPVDQLPPALPLSAGEAPIGSEVFTMGFPHTDLMGRKPKLTSGIINALTGLQDDPRTYQISVPVQSGNSGGPLINKKGEVVGVVTAKLSALKVFRWTGDLPQNVNYAVKSTYLASLIGSVPANAAAPGELARRPGTLEELAARVGDSVMIVLAK